AEPRGPRDRLGHREPGGLELRLEALECRERLRRRLPRYVGGPHTLAALLERAVVHERVERGVEQRGVERRTEPALQFALRDAEPRRELRRERGDVTLDAGAHFVPPRRREPASGGGLLDQRG